MPVEIYHKYKIEELPDLSKCKAYSRFKIKEIYNILPWLKVKDVCYFQGKLDNLPDLVLKEGAYFYPGVVRGFRTKIDTTLNDFSEHNSSPFLSDFKWNIHLYALLKFKPKMKSFQEKWDKENTPLGMLDQKKDEYLKVIDTRLQYGHTLISEGHIVGDYLLRVIHKRAMNAGNSERKKAVRDIAWLTYAESIRLKYFEKLAEQVQNGNKEEAIRHFLSPKQCIEDWYKCMVDNNPSGNPEQKYEDTFNAEFDQVLQDIRNCQSFEEIKKFVNNYMTKVDKVDYKLDLEDITKEDLKIFRDAIEEELKTKGGGRYPRQELFESPSDDKSIMELLGCTEVCYWCGALCWGSQNHHKNSDMTKIHHTSHQPRGLRFTKYRDTKELVARACHKLLDDLDVWYYGKEKSTKWDVAKVRDFSDWKFEPHYKHFFNDLMCWFFEKLHEDLAKIKGFKPSTHEELNSNGCLNLDYHDIISSLKAKIQ